MACSSCSSAEPKDPDSWAVALTAGGALIHLRLYCKFGAVSRRAWVALPGHHVQFVHFCMCILCPLWPRAASMQKH